MKNWIYKNELEVNSDNFKIENLIILLLENRGVKTSKEIEEYLNPDLDKLSADSLGIDKKQLLRTIKRIKKAIINKELIIVFGDYDVDGIAGSAILWENLISIGANSLPYIPHRVDEGYGLSTKGIENVLKKYPEAKIIITVDNGIVANEAVEFGNRKGLEIIITDHHAPGQKLPDAYSIVHSVKVCGASVAWFLACQIRNQKINSKDDDHLGLVALATITDVMQLNSFNRILVKLGLKNLRKTKRPGFIELFNLAGIKQESIGVYELGHVIGPRLNAMGRIEHAMDSLRFICTPNLDRAKELANLLHATNKERQELTFDSVNHAKNIFKSSVDKKLIIISDKNYNPGVIGLISGRLTEEYYRPSIVISEGVEFSKGSARSVAGFNIIEFIREFSDFLVDKGGHPMAAGFTVKTKDIESLKKAMQKRAEKEIEEQLLVRKLSIDCILPIDLINLSLFQEISKLSPFGYGNSEPVFSANNLTIKNMRYVGKDSNHVKLTFSTYTPSKSRSKLEILETASNQGRTLNSSNEIAGILFGYDKSLNLKIGDTASVAYTISLNEWNGNKNLELKIRDIKKAE